MTISKDRLEILSLRIAKEMQIGMSSTDLINFVHALIKRIENECEVVGWLCNGKPCDTDYPFKGDKKLITLPLIEE